jgi:probable phosphoglycerate mutase
MRIIFARHGNTFTPGETPYIVGANENLPLVESGVAQAIQFGQALKEAGVMPAICFIGPLTRHRQFAEIAMQRLGVEPTQLNQLLRIDRRLNEIDYGTWSGLTEEQIVQKFGTEVQENWTKRGVFPVGAGWKPELDQVTEDALSFLDDLETQYQDMDTVVAISSGGKLRYFLQTVPGEFEKHQASGELKVATGNMCVLDYSNGEWVLTGWNMSPTQIALVRT